ncbi:MAG: 16S rRNA (uracil(1498)-N(3))-methyltransferase [Thermoclostridium sp.]|nr:16S rRNA (uracil(1498)-N(3))-methyltransferase [Thermoclostridium sp.]
MHRFLIKPDDVDKDSLTLTGDDAKHMLQVLRFKPGDVFLAFDATGYEYEAEVASIGKSSVTGKIIKAWRPETEPEKNVILFQGIPKADKMDWIIQKSVELGVREIIPMVTQYSVIRMNERGLDGKLERWNRISREACKQSGRVRVPEVKAPMLYSDAVKLWSERVKEETNALTVYCYENEGKKCLKDLLICYNIDDSRTAGIFIGPEGGFSEGEVQLAQEHRFNPVSLGKRILRTETAAIAVLSVIMFEIGELNT